MNTTSTANSFGAALCRGIVLTSLLTAALTVRAAEHDQTATKGHAPGTDTAACLKEAAQMNAATIKFGQLASIKAQNSELKEFGEQLEKDHKKAQEKLETIAKKHDVVLPTTLAQECQDEMTKLQALSGSEFDKEFAKGAVQGHAMGIAKLQEASVQAKDTDVAQYTKDMLAQMKRHQVKAREVAKAVGLDQATIATLETQPPEGVGTAGKSSQSERESSSSKSTDPLNKKDTAPQPQP